MVIRWDDDPLCGLSPCGSFDEPQFIATNNTEQTQSSKASPILQRVQSRGPANASPLATTLRDEILDLRNNVGDNHPAVYSALNDAGRACADDGNHVDSLQFFDEALALQRYYLGYGHPSNADTLCSKADVMKANVNLNKSVEYFVTALGLYELAIQELTAHPDNEEWLRGGGNSNSIHSHLERVLELQCKVSSTYNNIGNVRFEQRRYDEAQKQYRKAMQVIRGAAKEAEQALTSTGESVEVAAAAAEGNANEIIEIVAERNGVHIEVTAPCGSEMIECSSEPGTPTRNGADEYDKINQLYRQALLQEADTLNNLANLHGERSEWAEAIRHYNFALHLQMQQLGEDNPVVANTLFNLGTMNYRYGNLSGALKSYKQVAKMRKNCLGSGIEVSDALTNVALVQAQMGDIEKAESMYSAALRIAMKCVGEKHIKVATIMLAMGDMFVQHKQEAEVALQFYSDAWVILKFNELPDDHFLLKSVTKKIMDLKFREMGDIGGAMSAMYEVLQALGIDAMPAFQDISVNNELRVNSLMDDMNRANVNLAAF